MPSRGDWLKYDWLKGLVPPIMACGSCSQGEMSLFWRVKSFAGSSHGAIVVDLVRELAAVGLFFSDDRGLVCPNMALAFRDAMLSGLALATPSYRCSQVGGGRINVEIGFAFRKDDADDRRAGFEGVACSVLLTDTSLSLC